MTKAIFYVFFIFCGVFIEAAELKNNLQKEVQPGLLPEKIDGSLIEKSANDAGSSVTLKTSRETNFARGREGEIVQKSSDELATNAPEAETATPLLPLENDLSTPPIPLTSQTSTPRQSVHARKGAPNRVQPRKGVDEEAFTESSSTSSYAPMQKPAAEVKPPVIIPSTTGKSTPYKQPSAINMKQTTTTASPELSDGIPPLSFDRMDKNYQKVEAALKTASTTSVSLTTEHHLLKPSVSVDNVSDGAGNNVPLIVGISVSCFVILIVSVLAYKKIQDVWSRRHYDRMDFLIDGMYDL